MIALCRAHHDAAEAGTFSQEELRQLKASPADQPATNYFPWAKRQFLVRLGGCYSGGAGTHVAIAGDPVVQLTRAHNGLLLLSTRLLSSDGRVILEIDENDLIVASEDLYDLEVNTGSTKLRAWLGERHLGVDLAFRRVSIDSLSQQLDHDRQRAESRIPKLEDLIAQFPDDIKAIVQSPSGLRGMLSSMPGLDRLPEHVREAFLSGDQVGTFVKRWAQERCMDEDGLIPMLDFDHLSLNSQGRHVEIHDGVGGQGPFIGYSAAFDNHSGAFNL